MKYYIFKNLLAWDMAICALIFPKAKPRETISGYLGYYHDKSLAEIAVNKLFYNRFWKLWPDNDHCDDVAKTEKKMFDDLNY